MWHQCRHRIDNDDVDGIRLDQQFGDLHRFLTAGRLADEELLQRDAELFSPARIERVFGVDEGGDATGALGRSDRMQGNCRLTARFGAEDLDDSASGKALAAEGEIDRETAAGDAFDRRLGVAVEWHDRAFAKLLLDLQECVFQQRVVVEKVGGVLAAALPLGVCRGGGPFF